MPAKAGTRNKSTQTDQSGRRISIIEDDPFSLELYMIPLEAAGFTMLPAADGEQGLSLARREQPDLIICDVILPKMGGCEVVRQLKSDPVLAGPRRRGDRPRRPGRLRPSAGRRF